MTTLAHHLKDKRHGMADRVCFVGSFRDAKECSLRGIAVAVLSATGVIIWWKKRTARIRSARLKAIGRG